MRPFLPARIPAAASSSPGLVSLRLLAVLGRVVHADVQAGRTREGERLELAADFDLAGIPIRAGGVRPIVARDPLGTLPPPA